MANNAEQRKRTRKEIKRNASASHSGRTLALLALERLALAGLVQRTSVFVEDETLRYSTRRTRTHLPVKAAETASPDLTCQLSPSSTRTCQLSPSSTRRH